MKSKNLISKKISIILEAIFVLTIGFGIFIYSSTKNAFLYADSITPQTYNSYDFYFIVTYDLIVLSIIFRILKRNHWTWNDYQLQFSPSMFQIGVLLAFFNLFSRFILHLFLENIGLISNNNQAIILNSNVISIILMIIVNSFIEEFLLIGYLFKRFENLNPFLIIFISLIIRISYHTYQGWQASIGIAIMALIFGFYFYKYKKLWPLILAHAIGNTFHFLNYKFNWITI